MPETPNHTNNYLIFQNCNVVVFHSDNIPESQADDESQIKMASRQAVYAFIVTVLLNLVQIKFQGKAASPFQTNPKTMIFAVASLLLYYWASYFATKLRTANPPSSALPNDDTSWAAYFSKVGLGFCGPLSLASILSVILPQSLCPLAFSASLLFSLSQMMSQSHVKMIWKMVTKATTYIMEKFRGQPHSHALRRRRGGGEIHVELPGWLPQLTNIAMSNHVGTLPL
ncbi:OLC1v1031687C1 [Oldenlandia corymbosa var. corymbosa]|uniref:OLC1v1031687C1 n=1 Tax=Oldenlandia corymbosa var. corymbosa TaxID=529605 RepID=A0AAV1CJW9_OLDCO|nr:OLC1v1031687C1 [Oldenlandia corymbosa var. corymbosa]